LWSNRSILDELYLLNLHIQHRRNGRGTVGQDGGGDGDVGGDEPEGRGGSDPGCRGQGDIKCVGEDGLRCGRGVGGVQGRQGTGAGIPRHASLQLLRHRFDEIEKGSHDGLPSVQPCSQRWRLPEVVRTDADVVGSS